MIPVFTRKWRTFRLRHGLKAVQIIERPTYGKDYAHYEHSTERWYA